MAGRRRVDVPALVAALRRDYAGAELDPGGFAADPMTQFGVWFDEAVAARLPEPNAMCLATVAADGTPSTRTVLLKEWDARGFVFATNYRSRKGRDLAADPRVALAFRWAGLERQVCVTGAARRTTRAESAEIFAARPLGAQLAAWASPQSEPIPERAELDRRYAEAQRRFGDGPVPCPPYWGGVRVRPVTVEFWAGRANRMHERLRYARRGRGWVIERLAP